jgi:hypothetical protein
MAVFSDRNPCLIIKMKPIKFILLLSLYVCFTPESNGQKLLDAGELTATSTAAYSVRQLKTTYSHSTITPPTTVSGFTNSTTPLIRVRRSSDNGQLDIGFMASGELDTVTLKSFVGSNSGYISVWYDQSGNSRDVTQTTAANQPRIVNAGSVERSSSGKLSIRFVRDGSNTYAGSNNMSVSVRADTLFSSGLNGSALSVFEASSGNASAWGMANTGGRWQIHANEGGGLKFDYGDAFLRTSYENTANQGILKNYAFIAPVGSGGQIWINGILVSTGQVPSNPCSSTLFEIGGIQSFNNWNFDNRQSELILFKTALSTTDRTKASNDQGAFFLDLYIWSGAVSNDFADARNWKNNALPTLTSDIYVPLAATNAMTISNIYQVTNVTIETGATVTLASGGDLRVSGNVNYGGAFTGSGTLTLNGTSVQSLLGNSGGYGNITINNSAGVSMPVTATVNGTINFISGKLNIGNTTSNPVVTNTVTLNGGVTGSSATNCISVSNQTDLIWGSTATGTVYFDAGANNVRSLTLSGTSTLTLGSALSIDGGNVTIGAGTTLDLQTFTLNRTSSAGTLTINGTLRLGNNTGGQTGSNYPTNFTAPPTMGTNGVVEYDGSSSISQTVYATTYRNLLLTNGGGSGNAPKVSSGSFTVQGTFTIDTLSTFTPLATDIITGTSATLTGKGTVVANRITATADFNTQYNFTTRTLTNLTVNYAGTGAQTVNNTNTYGNIVISGSGTKTLGGAIDINRDLTISAGTLATSNNQINIAGNWTNNATYTAGTGTVVFDGTFQAIGGSSTTTFQVLSISTGTTYLTANAAIADVTGAGITIASGAVLDLKTFTLNRAGTTGTRVLTINGTFKLGAATGGETGSNYPSNFTAPPTMGTGGIVEYNGTNDQVQTVFATTYRNLTLTNGSGSGSAVKNASANFTVQTTFTVNSGAVFSPNSSSLVFTGTGATLTGTGTIIRRTVLTTQYPSFTINTPPLIVVDGTSSSIAAGTYSNIYVSVNTTLSGAIVVTGDITIISGTLTASNNNITLSGNWTNNGTFTPGTNTVTFNGTSKQVISGTTATTFNNLTNSNTTDTLVVNTNFSIATGRTLTLNGANTVIQPAATVVITGSGTGTTITGTGTVRVTRTASTANYASQYPFTTNILTNLTVDYCADAAQTVTIGATGINYNNLVISGSGTKTITADISASNVTGNISVRKTATLANGGFAIVGPAAKTFTLDSNATLSLTGTSVFPTGFGTFAIDSHSTVSFAGAAQTIAARQYGHLTIGGSSSKTPASGTHTILGNFLITASTYNASTNNPVLNFGGNFSNSGGTYTTGTGTITFNGTIQTISGTPTFNNLTISSSGSTTLASNITISDATGGNLTVSAGSIFDLNTFTANRAGTTTGSRVLTINGRMRLNGTSNFPTNFTSPPTVGSSSTVEYYLTTGAQTISAITYNNLVLSNTSGTQTAAGNITVNGALTMNGGILNLGTNTLSGTNLTTSGSGTIQTQNTSGTPVPVGRTWLFEIVYNSSSAQTIVNGNYQNLTASGGNRTLQSSGTIGIAGIFTAGTGTYTVTGSTVDFNGSGVQTIPAMSFNNLSVSGTKSGSPGLTLYPGTITIAGNFSNTSTGLGTVFTSGSKVDYNGGTQNVAALTYGKLSISGTGLKTLAGNTVVNDSMTVGGTSGLNGSGYTLTVLGPWINNATYNGASGTVIFNGYSNQVISGTTSPSYNAFTLDNSAGVTLSTGITVGGTMTITNGNLTLGANTIVLNGLISSSASACFSSNGSSNITMGGNANGTFYCDQTTSGTTNRFGAITINRTGNTITMGSDLQIATALNLTAGKLAIGPNTLTLAGTLSNTASNCLVANGSSDIIINGSGALGTNLFLDQTTPGTTNRLSSLTYNRSSVTITLGDTVEVTGMVTPAAGTLATSNKLKLISNASGDAGLLAGTGTYISGAVTVQRYIPSSGRRWRFLSSPSVGATLADWKTDIFITGLGGSTNGFDQTLSNQDGVYRYNEAATGDLNQGWIAPSSITEALVTGRGYRVFVRGDRDPGRLNGTITTQNAVTLKLVKSVTTGDVTMSPTYTSTGVLANDGWNLMGNPYPCAIDWNAFHDAGRSGSSPNYSGTDYQKLDAIVYVLDPGGASTSYASYNAFSGAVVGDLAGGIIPSGAAFWVKASAASPTMTMKEIYKTSAAAGSLFKTSPENTQFSVKVMQDGRVGDETVIKYVGEATSGLDAYDIAKVYGMDINIASIGSDGSYLAANYKPFNGVSDTIRLSLGITTSGEYKMVFSDPGNMGFGPDKRIYLVDQYEKQVRDIGTTNGYSFQVDIGNNLTLGNDRFMLVVGDITTGVPDFGKSKENDARLYLYPAATNGITTIYGYGKQSEKVEISVTNMEGQVIMHKETVWDNDQLQVDLTGSQVGLYFITIRDAQQTHTFKCVMQ